MDDPQKILKSPVGEREVFNIKLDQPKHCKNLHKVSVNLPKTNCLKAELLKGSIFRLLFMGLSFLAGLLIAAISGTELFGRLSLMIVNAAVLLIFTGLGTDAALVWHWAGERLNPRAGYSFVILTGLLQLILFGAGEWISVRMMNQTLLTGHEGNSYLYLEVLYFTGIVLMEKWGSLFYAAHKATRANQVLALVSLVFVVFLLGAYQGKGVKVEDPLSLFAAFTFIQGLSLTVAFHFAVPDSRPGMLSRADLKSLFSFSFLVFVTNGLQFLAYRIDFWFLDHYFGESEVGIYAQANRFAQLFWVVPNILAALLIPSLSRKEGAMLLHDFLAYPRLLVKWNLALVLAIPLVAWLIYQYLMPETFMPGFGALWRMLPGYCFFGITLILAAWFSAMGQLKVNLAGSALCLVLITLADAAFIPVYGSNGAAWANTVAYSLTTLYFMIQFMHHTKSPIMAFWKKNNR